MNPTRLTGPHVDIRRAPQRFRTHTGWLDSHHSFSFAGHYDPDNTHHGQLLVSNDDVIKAGTGFQTHPHQDMEIVTWVLSGELEHKDSVGNQDIIYPGLAQRMSAGTGIWHSEMNPRDDRPVHLVQMWVLPDTERVTPGYQQLDINAELDKGGLVPVASGQGHQAAIAIRQRGAVLWAGRLKPGETVRLPDAPYLHLYIARGTADLEGAGALATGDAARLTAAGTPQLTADRTDGAEVLIWEMHGARETSGVRQ
jgi:redox-sensitive bicupin YhaK (pirin superfamily)